ncbi:hypothetical protein T12_5371 [Trichinella patagoniensis]|uniref:Uncharacterized protein n=1 Tax=Trichinella patagoniensis TaxID=990121 RepID=A0A0V0Z7M2_9BILA|nr:hypothetical protein T12_5371 [Trichinella patagoniensis]
MHITFEIVNANGKDAMLAPNRKTVKASSFHKAVEMTSLEILSIGAPIVYNPLPSVHMCTMFCMKKG